MSLILLQIKRTCLIDFRYVVSVSNKFITWDVHTSDLARTVDPKVEGLMMDLQIRWVLVNSLKCFLQGWWNGTAYFILKPLLKVGSVNKAGCFDIKASSSFLGIKLFCFPRYVESWWNFNSIRQPIEKMSEWVEILWDFTKIYFQTDAENFSFLSWKTKKFYS